MLGFTDRGNRTRRKEDAHFTLFERPNGIDADMSAEKSVLKSPPDWLHSLDRVHQP
jgi:hypothetical protein